MAIVDRMANISPTYLLAIAQVKTSCHFVHKEPAHGSAKSLGAGDVLVRKHVDAGIFRSGRLLLFERPPLPAMDIGEGAGEMETSDLVNEGRAW
jgi:hypothetical protein